MPESLLSPSGIKLFGRPLPGFGVAGIAAGIGANKFLEKQISDSSAGFARIYGYSYEGTYYPLAKPAIFLVHGPGTPAPATTPAAPRARMARGPSNTDQSGVADKDWEFSSDIMMWEYDKGDFSLRLDVTTGTFEDILLEADIETQLQTSSAARVQISGAARMQISHAARMQIAHRRGE